MKIAVILKFIIALTEMFNAYIIINGILITKEATDMKKLFSLLLSLFMLCPFASFFIAQGASLGEGTDAIRRTFDEGTALLDYVYFSPVKGPEDETKYPLILWLHGNASGDYPGHQLVNSDIHKLASDELQARFRDAGGAFLLLPRDPTENVGLAWDLTVDKAKSVLDSFIEDNINNIDLERIYAGGNSMGGKGAYKIAAAYPEVFAAIFPVSPVYVPSKAEMNALSDTAVWIFSNANDNYPQLLPDVVRSSFSQLNDYSQNPGNNRWSLFSDYYSTGGTLQPDEVHNTWTPVLNDLFMDDGSEYMAMTTVDGEGNKIKLTYPDGFISWLSAQSLSEKASAAAPKGMLARLIEMISNIINAIISIFGL